jgi:hypothetical protein
MVKLKMLPTILNYSKKRGKKTNPHMMFSQRGMFKLWSFLCYTFWYDVVQTYHSTWHYIPTDSGF